MTGGHDDGLSRAQTEAELKALLRDLARAPRAVQTATRRTMRASGQSVMADAQANASWSTKIPAAMRLRVSLAGANPGVELRVDTKAARHARVMEGFSGQTFRHPVFARPGRPTVWVAQSARPYLLPAARAGSDELVTATREAVDEALSSVNL